MWFVFSGASEFDDLKWKPFLVLLSQCISEDIRKKRFFFFSEKKNLLKMSLNSVAASFSSKAFFKKKCLLEKQVSHWGKELGLFQAYYFTASCQRETRGGGWGFTVARQTIKLVLNTFPYEGSPLLPKIQEQGDRFQCKYCWDGAR